MKQTQAIHEALKRLMRARGKTYAEAAKVLQLSEASIKRLFSRTELSLELWPKLGGTVAAFRLETEAGRVDLMRTATATREILPCLYVQIV